MLQHRVGLLFVGWRFTESLHITVTLVWWSLFHFFICFFCAFSCFFCCLLYCLLYFA